MSWDRGAVRRLVEDAFLPEAFEAFCFDFFPTVYRELTPGMAQSQRVLLLVENAWVRGEMDRLVEAVREANPRVYEEHAPRLRGEVESSAIPQPGSPELYQELCQRGHRDFEEVVFRLGVPISDLPYETSQAVRARALLAWCRSPGRPGEKAVATALAEVSRRRTWPAALAEIVFRGLSRLCPRLYARLAEQGAVPRPPEERAVTEYLAGFEREMAARNGADLVYIPQAAGEVAGTGHYEGDVPFGIPRGRAIHQVRQILRLLEGLSRGGDRVTAQLASVHRASRVVRSAVRLLLRSRKPLILLGDPGSGKSTTLREVGRRLAARERWLRRPQVVVYLPLGLYWSVEEGGPGSVFDLIAQAIPAQHARVRDALPLLIAERRLVVLFDGMDEMERRLYGERVRALSRFARDHTGEIKTLFACRINDFMPEFEHRQMVLLSFDRRQVTEYARKNLTYPLYIGGVEHTLKQFVTRLLRSDELGETASNPLLLFLICHYVRWIGEWPQSRAALFQTYVERVYTRWASGARAEGSQLSLEEAQDGWSRLAFLITSRSTGTFGEPDLLASEIGLERARLVVESGRSCGLLLPDPDERAVRFSHHRLQEYLAAFHIFRFRPDLDWGLLLDTPRWQETLLNLVSLQPQSDALQALQELLQVPVDEPQEEKDKKKEEARKLDPEQESLLADRVVLASHVLREVGAERDVAPPGFRETFKDALGRLAAIGRPTSQVKMLWAWKNVADWCPFDPLRQPLRSSLSWVREQAMLVLGALSGTRAGSMSHLREELALDFANGNLLRRFPTYWRMIRQDETRRWWPTALWATAWWLIYCATILGLGAGVTMLAVTWFPLPWIGETHARALFLGVFFLGLVGFSRFWGTGFVLPSVCLGCVLAVMEVFIQVAEMEPGGGLGDAFMMVWDLLPIALGVVLLGQLAFWLTYLLSVLPSGRNLFLKPAAQARIVENDSAVFGGFAILLAGRAIPLLFDFLESAESSGGWLGVVFWILVGAGVLIPIFMLGWLFWEEGFRSGSLFLLFVLPLGGICGMAVWFFETDLGRKTALWILGGALMLFPLLIILRLVWLLFRILALSWRRYSPEEWIALVSNLDPWLQRFVLTRTGRYHLGLSSQEFLQVLRRLEDKVKEDPGASAYWRIRLELEQTLRQERLDGW